MREGQLKCRYKGREAGEYERIRLEVLEPEGVTRCQHSLSLSLTVKIQPVAPKYTGETQMCNLNLNQLNIIHSSASEF